MSIVDGLTVKWWELEDGYYLAKNEHGVKLFQVRTNVKLRDDYKLSPKTYKTPIVLGHIASSHEFQNCEFKRVDLDDLWEFV